MRNVSFTSIFYNIFHVREKKKKKERKILYNDKKVTKEVKNKYV